jgi:UDP-N-acetylglucosamine transferase subunit ALG13
MILVTTGTNGAPFDRLLRAVDSIGTGEPLVVQHGPSSVRPRGATCVDYLPFGLLVEHVRAARLVVTHGGVGSVVVTLMHGRRPIVVPRLGRFREAVDDHQLVFAQRLARAGQITLVSDLTRLHEALASAADDGAADAPAGTGQLALDLTRYLRSVVDEPRL